ncbi:carboxypeptidase-like regulatory domain-containing protein [Pontibacter arcticus]|uniref:CarboxypepD_reg-like domain-containing protein n=1 Tax=Pontibacter arcticus TaxID=2080288 RepID=A0A364RDM7_9BACT|nr:carboxypeptidase-like regulatory domain-containing protein [Pontibacter arcticus]RAU82374.1 hypothetical protein DP923_11350 [Pontibacter arcticus]
MKFYFTLLLALAASMVFAQEKTISGTVASAKNGEAIPYVNIGIRNKNTGTISAENGSYTLKLQQEFSEDTLTFSAIGFEVQKVPVKQLATQQSIALKEKTTNLKEVVVTSRKTRLKKLGITGRLPGVWGAPMQNVDKERDVYEYANLIPVKKYPVEVLSAHFYLASSKLDSAVFRVNFYKNAQGQPGELLVEKSIVQKLTTKDGWVKVDLEPHQIYASEDFFLGIEYLPEEVPNRFAILMGGKLGGTTFTRSSSLGVWKETVIGSLSAYVTVRQ